MSLLSSFIQNQLIKAIEAEFINHSADMQAIIVNEVKSFIEQGAAWVESKINHQQPTANQEQPK